ncbi:carboxypeptidase-like regulatory domain-containing protein [Hyalangium sp.]|uniref:MSCRAMM family protein n=1 Tax=Hyalangium sp. TaxID=2028555 RepID=UPI002D561495|nr:carboxypeptidase-like regulatory domain-containing protein [Hyalangium sp.]HYH99394.1 carboxypeptidase-like regulatory domain-containing protein [Hyalangium sp.]
MGRWRATRAIAVVGAVLVTLLALILGFLRSSPSHEQGARASTRSRAAEPPARSPKPSLPKLPPGSGETIPALAPEPHKQPSPEGTLEVEVFSGNAPLPGAQVQLYVREPAELQSFPSRWISVPGGTTGADGRWSQAVAPGSYYVTARVQGLAPGYATVVQPPGPARTRVWLPLLKTSGIRRGLTLERGTGAPVSLAEILLTPPASTSGPAGYPDAPEEELLVAISSETGAFQFSNLAPGTYRVEARAPGYASAVLPEAWISTEPLFLELARSGQVEGVVLRGEGQPAVSAELFATSLRHSATVLTDSEGRFSVDLPSGTYAVSSKAGEEAGALERVTVEEGKRVEGLRLQLGVGARISGKVVRKDGSPVLGARVDAWRQPTQGAVGAVRSRAFAGTDGSGAFSLSSLAAGTYVLKVSLPGGGQLQPAPLTLAAGEHTSVVWTCEPRDDTGCQLPHSQASLQGRVLHPHGVPVRSVLLTIRSGDSPPPWKTYKFMGDRFEAHGLPPGPTQLSVTGDDMKAGIHLELHPEERRVLELPVYPPVPVTGRILDAATRQPVEGAWVLHQSTGKDGRFASHVGTPGEFLFKVTRRSSVTWHRVKLLPAQANEVGDIEVPAP